MSPNKLKDNKTLLDIIFNTLCKTITETLKLSENLLDFQRSSIEWPQSDTTQHSSASISMSEKQKNRIVTCLSPFSSSLRISCAPNNTAEPTCVTCTHPQLSIFTQKQLYSGLHRRNGGKTDGAQKEIKDSRARARERERERGRALPVGRRRRAICLWSRAVGQGLGGAVSSSIAAKF